MLENNKFNRSYFLRQISEISHWDVIVIGGGATGLGIALDAVSRGFSTLLLEQSDFAKGTSSRSTKLVHGGVRYLAQGNIRLVYDALHERGIMLKNAAHLVKKQSFIIPCYSYFSKLKYFTGLKLYDWLSGRYSFGKSGSLSKKAITRHLPGLKTKGLVGGIEYFDGQFDDARLAINIAQTCAEKGGVLLNYFKVKGIVKTNNIVSGVKAFDVENNREHTFSSSVVINATGVFVDDVLKMDDPDKKPLVQPSQGVHLVLNKRFLKGESAIMIPETADGRVLFAVPWHNHVLLGTTDTPLEQHSIEPVALQKEIDFILTTVKKYLTVPPLMEDVLSVYAGLRPLAAPDKSTDATKEISRDHKLIVSPSGLITITGGKWTTYRKMAEETIDAAIKTGKLKPASCTTKEIPIHGFTLSDHGNYLSVYGTDAEKIKALIKETTSLGKPLVDHLPYTEAEVVWAARYEMARTVEDVLARRVRILFLDARAALAAAPRVAFLLAGELGYDENWQRKQVAEFTQLANQYLIKKETVKSIKMENPWIEKAS